MSNIIAIVGESGSGKTTALLPNKAYNIEGLDPKETIFVSIAGSGKPLLFPGAKKVYKTGKPNEGANHIIQSNPSKVATIIRVIGGGLKNTEDGPKVVNPEERYKHIKNIVLDDAQYLQGFTFMDKVIEKGYDKFSEIGQAGYLPLKAAADIVRDDLNIIFTYHSEETGKGGKKIKTAGKVVDSMLTIEGLFSYVFFTATYFDFSTKETKYVFQTRTDGFTSAKTPPGCFKDFEVPNDLGPILKRIHEYLNA